MHREVDGSISGQFPGNGIIHAGNSCLGKQAQNSFHDIQLRANYNMV